ncbi:MAG: RDD family protein [Clostridiales bacterium]|nr:RDD family protein [Candidatus Crickella equi]
MNKRVLKLASRGKRFGAYCIDKALPAILFIVLISTISLASMTNSFANPYSEFGFDYGYGYGLGTNSVGAIFKVLLILALQLAYLVVQLIFYSKSQTIGKAILGMQVISSKDGKPIGIWMMILREWIAKKASGAAFLLGYLWILIDDKNRGWHDKIMDTYVIDLKASAPLNQKPEVVSEEKGEEPAPVEEIVEERIESIVEEPEVEIIEGGNTLE